MALGSLDFPSLPRPPTAGLLCAGAAVACARITALHTVAPNGSPREAMRGCWKFGALFGVHNFPGGVPNNQFLMMPRPWRRSAWPVFLIIHRSPQ
jgi:hypothetical protein